MKSFATVAGFVVVFAAFLALRALAAQPAASSTSCNYTGPCVTYQNTTSGPGIAGISASGAGVVARTGGPGPALSAVTSGSGNVILAARSGNPNSLMHVDSNGNMGISGTLSVARNASVKGKLTVSGGCKGCTTKQSIDSYAARVSEPTLEDFGEARLTAGGAHILLDSHFAAAIAQQPNYLVFITPEGDSRGLYVTRKSLTGFDVP
jgi:hypothetical protein